MKFLCVSCDQPMKLSHTRPPERGSLTAVYTCPSCAHAIAMLTNPMETELVTSLGVKIGPAATGGAAAAEGVAPDGTAAERAAAGGCPFSGVVAEMEATAEDGISWTREALARLDNIPEFVRPMARQGVEQYAESQGHAVVDEKVLDEARERFGM